MRVGVAICIGLDAGFRFKTFPVPPENRVAVCPLAWDDRFTTSRERQAIHAAIGHVYVQGPGIKVPCLPSDRRSEPFPIAALPPARTNRSPLGSVHHRSYHCPRNLPKFISKYLALMKSLRHVQTQCTSFTQGRSGWSQGTIKKSVVLLIEN